jgi:hypothetical protein
LSVSKIIVFRFSETRRPSVSSRGAIRTPWRLS